MRVALYTLGCKVNSYETEKIRQEFANLGAQIVPFTEPADVYVVNTCTVTQVASKKSRQILSRARRLNPNALVVATGCYVEEGDAALEPLADLLVVNRDKLDIPRLVREKADPEQPALQKPAGTEYTIGRSPDPAMGERSRAVLKVQDGCRQFCSYCIIPYVRGPLVSAEPEKVLSETETLVKAGFAEVVVTGIHLSSYGRKGTFADKNFSYTLPELLRQIGQVPGIRRIRLGSLEPGLITDEYVKEAAKVPELCPHYHLSLQSGCAATLRAMNRRYTPEQYLEALDRLRDAFPNVCFTTDLIVGFPGETKDDFVESLRFLEKARFTKVHVFPYSVRKGTKAASLPDQVPEAEKKRRAELAIDVASRIALEESKRFVGTVQEVLVEEEADGLYVGYTANYLRMGVRSEVPIAPGSIVSAEAEETRLIKGEVFLSGGLVSWI